MEKEQIFAIDFADWINNNWYVPMNDGFWRIEVENEEYTLDIPEVNVFSTAELMGFFINYLKEIEDNKSEEEKIQEYLKEKLSKKRKEDVALDLSVYSSYDYNKNNFFEKALQYLKNNF